MPIDHSLLREIQLKSAKLDSNPSYYLAKSKRIESSLAHSSKLYSWWMEHPAERRAMLSKLSPEDAKKLKDKVQKGVMSLWNAWYTLKGMDDPLTSDSVARIGRIVEPYVNQNGFRTGGLTLLSGLNYLPPNPVKVPSMLENSLEQIKKGDLHPVEKAAMTHLYVAGIQPFADGNKRVGRLIQDKVLYDANLPVAAIPSGERAVYLDLLDQALVGWRDGHLKPQRPFFDYIGGKVNTALDQIIGDLNIRVRKKYH